MPEGAGHPTRPKLSRQSKFPLATRCLADPSTEDAVGIEPASASAEGLRPRRSDTSPESNSTPVLLNLPQTPLDFGFLLGRNDFGGLPRNFGLAASL